MANDVPSSAISELAPSGRLRAAINFGNSVLVQLDPGEGRRAVFRLSLLANLRDGSVYRSTM